MTNKKLLEQIKNTRQQEKRTTAEMLKLLKQMYERKLYVDDYGTFYKYLVRGLKYSEGEANLRISALKIMKRTPVVSKKVESGELSLTSLGTINSHLQAYEKQHDKSLSKQETEEILELVSEKTVKETDDLLGETLKAKPKKLTTVTLPDNLETMLHKIQKKLGTLTLVETIAVLAEKELRDNIETKRQTEISPKNSRYIPVQVKEVVFKRAQNNCEHPGCREKRNLQLDHVIPFSKGGDNSLGNIQLLCRGHNLSKGSSLPSN